MEQNVLYPKTIIKAIHEVMQKVGYVQKKDTNQYHRYKYAGEAALLEALRPAMIEAGLILIPSGKTLVPIDEWGNTHLTMEYTLAHISGDVWPEKICAFGVGGDRSKEGKAGDKGTYKAITGAGKYLLFKLFLIETGDDPENDGGKKQAPKDTSKAGQSIITEDQRIRLRTIATKNKWPDSAVKSLIATCGYKSSKDIKWQDYEKIVKELEVEFDIPM